MWKEDGCKDDCLWSSDQKIFTYLSWRKIWHVSLKLFRDAVFVETSKWIKVQPTIRSRNSEYDKTLLTKGKSKWKKELSGV